MIKKGLLDKNENNFFGKDLSNISYDKTNLEDVVKNIKATILVGSSTKRNSFTDGVIYSMNKNTKRPIIFCLSNPTSLCERDPQDIYKISKNALVATGSYYEGVAQANNALIFPSIANFIIQYQRNMQVKDYITIANILADLSYADNKVLKSIEELKETTRIIVNKMLEQYNIKYISNILWEY